jgi:hypothetical protein
MRAEGNLDTKRRKSRSPHVPGQALGYSLQVTRFVALLLQSPKDANVSLEVFEDIGAETPDKRRKAIQSKSTADRNPVADHAVDLWKTLSNWVDQVREGELDPDQTAFEIYVSKQIHGDIVESFSEASSIEEAERALSRARDKLWGPLPERKNRGSVAPLIHSYVDNFLDADEANVCRIIQHFKLVMGSGSPQADLRELFAQPLVPEDLVDPAQEYALGWVKLRTDQLLERKVPAIISVAEFRISMQAFMRKYDSRTMLRSFAKDPNPQQIKAEVVKNYVRQLELIEASDDQKMRAITDYLRASVDRTTWSEKGLVFEGSFDEFEDNLKRAWENLKVRTFLANKTGSEEEKGQALYSECSLHQANLQNMETPPHFIPGSFNSLADANNIGWHPDYRSRLAGLRNNEEKNDEHSE